MNEPLEVSTFNPGQSTDSFMAPGQQAQQQVPQQAQAPGTDPQVPENPEPPLVTAEGQAQTQAPVEQKPMDPPQTQAAAQATLKNVGLDISEFENEYMANGSLSDASVDKLVKAGIPKTMVDSYIKGQEALAARYIESIHAIAGGAEGYAAMSEWAAKNVSADELKAFNHVMTSGNKELISLAVTGLTARWKSSQGTAPRLAQGRSAPSRHNGDVFESTAEMTRAINDPRYGVDPAYTNAVGMKIGRSNIFG